MRLNFSIKGTKPVSYTHLIRGFLDEHFTEKISLDELANLFYISKYHMSGEFKKAFGITVGSYVNSQMCIRDRYQADPHIL